MNRTLEEWQERVDELRAYGEWLFWELRVAQLKYYEKDVDKSLNRGIMGTRGWVTKGGKHIYIGDSKGGGGASNEPRLDMEGVPFDMPTLYLPPAEYKRVTSEISTNYANHRGKPYSKIDIANTVYSFENRRFGDYNIYDKYKK